MKLSAEAVAAWEKLSQAVIQEDIQLVSLHDLVLLAKELRTKWPSGYFDKITEQSLRDLQHLPGVTVQQLKPSAILSVNTGDKVYHVTARYDFPDQPCTLTWYTPGQGSVALRYVQNIGEIHDYIKELQTLNTAKEQHGPDATTEGHTDAPTA